MPRTITAEGRTITVPDDATDDEINQIFGPAPKTASSAPTASAPLGLFDTMKRNFNANTQGAAPGDGLILGSLKNFGAGGGDVIRSLAHPIRTAESILSQPDPALLSLGAMGLGPEKERAKGIAEGPVPSIPRMAGQIGTGAIVGEAVMGSPAAASELRARAIGNPDAAALRGLQVGPKSPKALGTIQNVEGARPFLQGAKSMEDLQAKIPIAKAEIWGSYQQAVDAIRERPVKGPDGITTVGELEGQRLQLSALNRGLKSGSPEAIQLAQQKGMTASQLLDQQRAVESALDPELASTGIDPKTIRKTFGNVAQVGGRVSGKTTLTEKPQPYGVGKVANSIGSFDITHPIASLVKPLGAALDGVSDIAAGRPWWSGKPTDVAIKDAFTKGGEKPSFGTFKTPTVKGLLSAPGPDDIDAPYEFGTPARSSIAPDVPPSFPRLPASTSDSELKPMIWSKANPHPGLAEDFARTRIVPSIGKIPSTTLPSETSGLALGTSERLGLPADVGDKTIDPRFLEKQSYPGLNPRTAIEKSPVVFAPKTPAMLNGLFTIDEDGQVVPTRKGLPAPPKKTVKGKK